MTMLRTVHQLYRTSTSRSKTIASRYIAKLLAPLPPAPVLDWNRRRNCHTGTRSVMDRHVTFATMRPRPTDTDHKYFLEHQPQVDHYVPGTAQQWSPYHQMFQSMCLAQWYSCSASFLVSFESSLVPCRVHCVLLTRQILSPFEFVHTFFYKVIDQMMEQLW